MLKKIIKTDQAPAAIGPYSQAVVYNNVVYCSGQIALDPKTMTMVEDDIKKQTQQVMENLERVLHKSGSNFSQVLKCSIFLKNMEDFSIVNEIYGTYFKNNPPARETVEVETLPKNALIEISCVAFI